MPETPVFLLPYDLPLQSYTNEDEPFVIVRCENVRLAKELDHRIYEKAPKDINIFLGRVPFCKEYCRDDESDIYEEDVEEDEIDYNRVEEEFEEQINPKMS